MAELHIWPNIDADGVSMVVYAEDGVTQIPAVGGALITLVQEFSGGPPILPSYYRDRLGIEFLTYDPLALSGDPISVPPITRVSGSLTGVVTTALASRAIISDGEVVVTTGYATPGDGGGGEFRGALGASSGADGYTKINTSNGQWIQLQKDEPIDIRWFGAVGDGVTPSTSAVQAALSAASSLGIRTVLVPCGTFLVDTIVMPSLTRLVGASRIKSRLKSLFAYSGGNTPSGSAAKGMIEITDAASDVYIENLSLYGSFDAWAAGTVVDANHMRHGIYVHPPGGAEDDCQDLYIRDVVIEWISGHGVSFDAHVFQSTCERVKVMQSGGDSFNAYGNNTLAFKECHGYSMAGDRAQFRIISGHPLLEKCNGIHNAGIDPDEHRVSWGIFGDPSGPALCRPYIYGCNIEGFTGYGCYFYSGSFADFVASTFIHSSPCVARALHFDGVGNEFAPDMAASVRLFISGSAQWGDPVTQTPDSVPVWSVGVPYVARDSISWELAKNSVGEYRVPSLRSKNVALAAYSLVLPRGRIETNYKMVRTITNASSPYSVQDDDHEIDVDSSGGSVTIVTTKDAVYEFSRELIITKISSDGNSVTFDPFGGNTVNGAATLSWSTQYHRKTLRCGSSSSTNWLSV